jgi:hypothetical protein
MITFLNIGLILYCPNYLNDYGLSSFLELIKFALVKFDLIIDNEMIFKT